MAILLDTVTKLQQDALWRAGEPTGGSSTFNAKALEYLDHIWTILLTGGNVAVGRDLATSAGIYAHLVDIPVTDWWWARSRAAITTKAVFEATVTLNNGSLSGSIPSAPSDDLAEYRIVVPGAYTVPRILTGGSSSTLLTIASAWPEATITTTARFVPTRYVLPSNFGRPTSRPYVHGANGYQIDLTSHESMQEVSPFNQMVQGPPTQGTIEQADNTNAYLWLNNWDTKRYAVELQYVIRPDQAISESAVVSRLPVQYMRVLSTGAAMLICFDKGDTRAEQLASEFRESVRAMATEHRRWIDGGSNAVGQFLIRKPMRRWRGSQPNGSTFLN